LLRAPRARVAEKSIRQHGERSERRGRKDTLR
jgi:hypothetical protein